MKKICVLVALAFALVGCAGKPELSEQHYTVLSDQWLAAYSCYQRGLISPHEHAKARQGMEAVIHSHQVDMVRFDSLVMGKQYMLSQIPTEYCRNLSAALAYQDVQQAAAYERKQQLNELNKALNNIGPKQTHCSSLGMMTSCNTY